MVPLWMSLHVYALEPEVIDPMLSFIRYFQANMPLTLLHIPDSLSKPWKGFGQNH